MTSPIQFLCPRWGYEAIPWNVFLAQVKDAGFSGIEWFPFAESGNYYDVLNLLKHYELEFAFVMAVTNPYQNFDQYLIQLAHDLNRLVEIREDNKTPLFISAQTGREFFDDNQIEKCLEICQQTQRKFETPIYQETHRNKWSFAAHRVGDLLKKKKDLRLTLDISHWFCVSESYLEDQQETVDEAIKHSRHIHARVGHTQGSQVWDPALEEYNEAFAAHLQVWDKWIAFMRQQNKPITITPEFGPAPYLIKGNRTTSLTEEQWRLNLWMKDFLKKRYS